jgi:hypothetical protein
VSHKLAPDPQLAVIGADDPSEHASECRFPGAVLADKRVDRAGLDRHANALQRLNATEMLSDAGGFNQGLAEPSPRLTGGKLGGPFLS